jgi:hypothetical protein
VPTEAVLSWLVLSTRHRLIFKSSLASPIYPIPVSNFISFGS